MDSASYETEIAELLDELSTVQSDLLGLLVEKRELLSAGDLKGLSAAQSRADELVARLAACQARRAAILARADNDGLPDDSVRSLVGALSDSNASKLSPSLADAQKRTRLLQHQSLTNWVIVQRSLIHLSQMIEILATGGRKKPTYGSGAAACAGGTLVDRAV